MRHKILRALAPLAGCALIGVLSAGQIWAQGSPPPPAAKDNKDTSKDAKSAKDSRDANAKDQAKDTAEQAKDTAKSAKDTAAKDSRDAKDAAQDARDTAKKDARDAGRDAARDARDRTDTGRSQARDSRDTQTRVQRDTGRDTYRDRDATSRDNRGEASGRGSFRASDIRSADIGLWFERNSRDGLVVSDVSSKGAIAKLGFREGDRLVSVNGHRISGEREFIDYLFADDVRNDRVKVIVLRGGREETILVEPALLVEDYEYVETDPLEQFGIVLDDRYNDRLIVWKVIPRSPAYYAGIRAGDVLVTFRGQPIRSSQEFVRTITSADAGNVDLQVRRGNRTRDLAVDMPRSDRRVTMRPNMDADGGETRREERKENRDDKRGEAPQAQPQGAAPPATGLQPSSQSQGNQPSDDNNNQRSGRGGLVPGRGR